MSLTIHSSDKHAIEKRKEKPSEPILGATYHEERASKKKHCARGIAMARFATFTKMHVVGIQHTMHRTHHVRTRMCMRIIEHVFECILVQRGDRSNSAAM